MRCRLSQFVILVVCATVTTQVGTLDIPNSTPIVYTLDAGLRPIFVAGEKGEQSNAANQKCSSVYLPIEGVEIPKNVVELAGATK